MGIEFGVNIYLVRHGEAVSERIDPQRPLSRVGREEVERVARMVADKNVPVSAVFHSGILRAKQTAEILAEHLRLTGKPEHLLGLLPQDDPAIAKAELETAEQSVLLVGHLPHLSRLLALLVNGAAGQEVMAFVPATVVCCRKDGAKWQIAWTLTPRHS